MTFEEAIAGTRRDKCLAPLPDDESYGRNMLVCGAPTLDGASYCANCRPRFYSADQRAAAQATVRTAIRSAVAQQLTSGVPADFFAR